MVHVLSALSAVTGVALLVMFIIYYHFTPNRKLVAEPASMVYVASLTATPSFNLLDLKPTDTADDVQRKVTNYRFRLREEDGGIEALPR